jgi:hypothetical protein
VRRLARHLRPHHHAVDALPQSPLFGARDQFASHSPAANSASNDKPANLRAPFGLQVTSHRHMYPPDQFATGNRHVHSMVVQPQKLLNAPPHRIRTGGIPQFLAQAAKIRRIGHRRFTDQEAIHNAQDIVPVCGDQGPGDRCPRHGHESAEDSRFDIVASPPSMQV